MKYLSTSGIDLSPAHPAAQPSDAHHGCGLVAAAALRREAFHIESQHYCCHWRRGHSFPPPIPSFDSSHTLVSTAINSCHSLSLGRPTATAASSSAGPAHSGHGNRGAVVLCLVRNARTVLSQRIIISVTTIHCAFPALLVF